MSIRRLSAIAILLLAASAAASAQCTASGVGTGSATTNGQVQCGQSAPIVIGTENVYCPKGPAPEMTEGSATWGSADDVATLPTGASSCMYTGTDATPSPGNFYTPATTTTLSNVLASVGAGAAVNSDGTLGGSGHLACGDTVTLTASATYVGEYAFPALPCDGLHWITIRSSGISNPLFPLEGVRATPCIAGISNDAINGRNLPGYPDYPCASFGTTLSAKIQQPVNANSSAISFTTTANHYRFIGIEFAQSLTVSVAKIVKLTDSSAPVEGLVLGANHIIFDRSLIHGVQWTPAAGTTAESGVGIAAKNSQWIAEINGWNYDTYCNSSCIDSQAFTAGTGLFQDGPFKIYNNLMASAGETILFGGGGQGAGTPNTTNFEIRVNHMLKPLTWMVPIDACNFYRDPEPKNLFELKNGILGLVEANVFEGSWQGCQSDQNGTAFKLNPANQNNHAAVTLTYDGTNVVHATAGSFIHHTTTSPASGNPVDAANCPPGGCVLGDIAANTEYRFCDIANGCDQSGIPSQQCGTGVNAGLACTSSIQCPGSYCAPTIVARINCGLSGQPACPAAAAGVAANACVPGDCPSCRNQDITVRYNEIYNATGGLSINTGLSSICHDQANGMARVSIHDNSIHGLSREMVNGVDPYSDATCFSLSNNALPPGVINTISVRHNTCAVEDAITPFTSAGVGSSSGSFFNQVDHSDIQYLQALAYTDNVAPGAATISRTAGTVVTKGIGGASGTANTYAVNACQRYFTNEAPLGAIPANNPQSFTFAGLPSGGTNYLASLNGQWVALSAGATPTSFTITPGTACGGSIGGTCTHLNDTLVVRDLNDCQWTFRSNLLATGVSGAVGISPNFFGAGLDRSPYPNFVAGITVPYACGAGGLAPCLLNETTSPGSFISNFASWGTGRIGDFSIASSSPYYQTASDAATRASTGQSPGADMIVLGTKTQGVRAATFFPALTITTATLPTGTHGVNYNAALAASAGASQFWLGYKSWWLETVAPLCAGSCGTLGGSGLVIGRDGVVNGPFAVLTISRTGCPTTCRSNYTVKETITGGAWVVGQVATMAQFLNGSGNAANDGSFAGTCAITALTSNGFACALTGGVNSNIPAHAPNGPTGPANGCGLLTNSQCPSTASFAPLAAGTYTFWVGVRDGAFQVTRKQISATIN